ncbi:hypothetical protein ALC62_14557, partial [Cyphomyrmex costatus]
SLQLIFSSFNDRIFVAVANTSEIVQRQIHNRHAAETLGLHECCFVTSGVRILVTCPEPLSSSFTIIRLISVAAVLLGWVTDSSQTSCRVLGQFGAHFGVGQQSWFVGVRPWGTWTFGHDGRHSGNLAVFRQFPRASVRRNTDDDLAAGSSILQPVPRRLLLLFRCIQRVSMRERTPSADDTPKRAPPAPSRGE